MSVEQKSFEFAKFDAEKALNTGLGFASPLWPTFFVATGAGLAYWWLASFAKSAARLEGIVPALALQTEVSVVEAAVPAAEAEVEPVLEAAAVVVEIAPEPELVAQAEIAPEAVAEVAAEPVVAEPEVLAAPPADTPAEALIEVPVATPKVAKVRKAKPKTVA